ncbi:MAG: hypothetical protein J1F20_05660 [Muribaculaceae bacterium]|nr:hypothetical protein [Muribaculaceae bacterium]
MFFDLAWYCRTQAPDRYDKAGSKAAVGVKGGSAVCQCNGDAEKRQRNGKEE